MIIPIRWGIFRRFRKIGVKRIIKSRREKIRTGFFSGRIRCSDKFAGSCFLFQAKVYNALLQFYNIINCFML